MMQEHSNRPQFFKMKGESVIVCESTQKKFLTLLENNSLVAPYLFVGDKFDFMTAINAYLSTKYSSVYDKFEIIGFIKMESQIIEDKFEQYIRNVYYVRFYGDDKLIPDFKTVEEIAQNSTDQSFLGYISYLQNGGIAYPLELFAYEGKEVTQPTYKTPYQKEQMKEFMNQQNYGNKKQIK